MALDKKNSEEKKKHTFFETHGCKWITAGRKCQMLGTMSSESKHWLCMWHFTAQSSPENIQNFEEFTAWRDKDREIYPRVWEYSGLYVNDNLVWACILGKEQRKEYVMAMIAIEKELEISVKGNNKSTNVPEVSAQKLAISFKGEDNEVPF